MASNSRGNQSYGYGFSDDKVAVKPVAQPAKPVKTKEAPKPKPQVMAQSGKKRVSHSRYMPFLIILIVLTLGMVFIGLVMTIVAHWPGYSAIGGNPLEIAGPVLLSVGAAGFIICMVIVCTQKSAEKKSYQKRFNKLATNARMVTMQQNVSMMQSSYMIPHQNRPPSMGSIGMHESQTILGQPQTPSVYTEDQSYSRNFDSHASDNSLDKVQNDPSGAGIVPTPVRPSSRKTKKQEALGDAAAAEDEEYGAEGGQPRKKHRHRRPEGDQGDEDPTRPKRKSKKKTDGEGSQLRIDIKAQPGTAVHIAPGSNYPPPSGANATVSSETEI